MAMKLALVALAAFTIVSANEKVKRQSGPDFNEYLTGFQEQLKPIIGSFPQMPNGFGSFPSFPGFPGQTGSSGSGSGSGSLYKRQAMPNTISEWFQQFQENGNNFSGNLPFKPPTFGHFPFGGTSESSGSNNEISENHES